MSVSDGQSIRPFLARLEREGSLLRIDKAVDPCFELSAFLSAADAGPALMFERIEGSELRAAGNLFNGRERIAAALGIETADILPRLRAAISNPVAAMAVHEAPVQACVTTENPLATLAGAAILRAGRAAVRHRGRHRRTRSRERPRQPVLRAARDPRRPHAR